VLKGVGKRLLVEVFQLFSDGAYPFASPKPPKYYNFVEVRERELVLLLSVFH
jgi:hypothetical protein